MDKRENLLRALRRQEPEYVPFSLSLCRSLQETFRKKTNMTDYMEYFEMPFRYIDILPSINPVDYSKYFSRLPEDAFIDEWGVGHIHGSFEHFTKMLHPMENFTTPEQVWDFPLPDVLDDYRWEGFAQNVEQIKKEAWQQYLVQFKFLNRHGI